MQNKLINLLAHQVSYPLGLAHEIGIDGAIAVVQIVANGCNKVIYGEGNGAIYIERLAEKLKSLAVRGPHQVIENLNTLGVISVDGGGLITLNNSFFQEINDLQVEVKSSIWQDKEFLALLTRWKSILISKGVRNKSEKDFTAMFEGKDAESAKQALQYSIDNRLTTLYYRENNRGHAKTDSFNRRGWANGGAGERVSSKPKGDSETPRAVHKGLESLDGEAV